MNIEEIIYNTTRILTNVEDKLSIAVVFLFCDGLGAMKLSELLYTNDHERFIENLNREYSNYEVDFTIRFSNVNVKEAFYLTLEEVIKKYDSNGFHKAVFEKDPFALAICDIIDYDFDKVVFKEFTGQLMGQLSLFN